MNQANTAGALLKKEKETDSDKHSSLFLKGTIKMFAMVGPPKTYFSLKLSWSVFTTLYFFVTYE